MENKLVLGFVFLLIGVILAGVLPTVGTDTYSKTIVVDETQSVASAKIHGDDFNASVNIPVTNAPTGYKIEDCPLESITVSNASGHDLTVTTDYTLSTTTGNLNIVNNTDTIADFTGSNNSLIDYTYCSDNYLTLAWGRTGITTGIGFFALGAFGVAIWLFYTIWRDKSIIK